MRGCLGLLLTLLCACATTGPAPKRPAATPAPGSVRVIGREALQQSGLPNTGDALRRRLPWVNHAAR
jgi:hypothetical protein